MEDEDVFITMIIHAGGHGLYVSLSEALETAKKLINWKGSKAITSWGCEYCEERELEVMTVIVQDTEFWYCRECALEQASYILASLIANLRNTKYIDF